MGQQTHYVAAQEASPDLDFGWGSAKDGSVEEVSWVRVREAELNARRLVQRKGQLALVANPGLQSSLKHFRNIARSIVSPPNRLHACMGFTVSCHSPAPSSLGRAAHALFSSLSVIKEESDKQYEVLPFNPGDTEHPFATVYDSRGGAMSVIQTAEAADFMVSPHDRLGHIAVLEPNNVKDIVGVSHVLPADTFVLDSGTYGLAWQRVHRAPDMNR